MIYLKKKNKGFTILETLVAITIILIAITGPLDIIANSLKASYYSRDEVTAFYLAQEAIEYAKNQRDNNQLDDNKLYTDWLEGVKGAGSVDCLNNVGTPNQNKCMLINNSDGSYQYDQCNTNGCALMKMHDGTEIYGASPGEFNALDTNFTREVYFTKVLDKSVDVSVQDPNGESDNEVIMTVNIYWSNNFGSDNKFTLTTHLFNWKITR